MPPETALQQQRAEEEEEKLKAGMVLVRLRVCCGFGLLRERWNFKHLIFDRLIHLWRSVKPHCQGLIVHFWLVIGTEGGRKKNRVHFFSGAHILNSAKGQIFLLAWHQVSERWRGKKQFFRHRTVFLGLGFGAWNKGVCPIFLHTGSWKCVWHGF